MSKLQNSAKLLIFIFSAGSSGAAELPETIDFNDHVQPILSENCYHCHGPDSSTRAPENNPLRLDREEDAFLPRKNGKPTIIKGDPGSSEFFKRIITKDIDDVMPPPESHKKPLNEHEVALLEKWIEQGAPYEDHWSFILPTKVEPPETDWGNNPIDKFIAQKHEEVGLNPSSPENPARLLRRLTFDITGLPPTPEEIVEFEKLATKDLSDAVAKTTERLLGTDAYAEHHGRHWLDAVRYADTHGIHIDNYRSIWPYRDWVIEAFRKNMNFRDFTVEQLAGDLLPEPSLDQVIATGFGRCMPTTGEGGAIAKEYEFIYATDRVETTSAIWLGLSTGCAACHDHKFDPISQKDFYAMSAFFRNTTMAAMDRNNAEHPPVVFAPLREDRERWDELEKNLKDADARIAARRKAAEGEFQTWLQQQSQEEESSDLPTISPKISLPLIVENGEIQGTAEGAPKKWKFTGKRVDREGFGKVINLEKVNVDLGDLIEFEARDQVTFGGYLKVDGSANGPIISRMDTGKNYRGWDFWLEGGKVGAHIVDQWPDKAIKAVTKSPLPRQKWVHVMVTYDGQAAPKESLKIFVDGKALPLTYSHSTVVESIATEVPVRLGARHKNALLKGKASFHGFQFHDRILSPGEIKQSATLTNVKQLLALAPEDRSKQQIETLRQHFLNKVDQPTGELLANKEALQTEKNSLRSRGAVTLVMEEKKEDAYAHILERGEYSLEKEKVWANIPEIFQSDDGDGQRKMSRKDLADWIVSDKNPLTARVTVNRIWYYFFGQGIVETTEDFGIMGARPTHPELLDYLAVEFVESGWDIQHIIRLITNSATYQQAAKTTSANREKDPGNLYLWRAPRFRLEAEQLRDLALAASGLLVEKIGGPSVKPYQPDGIWEAVAMNQSNTRFYKQDSGDNLYRRSLYTFWKRTAAPASMEILNAPTREVFCVRRDRTNTPLAAFVMMNDPQFIEASRELASNAMKRAGDFNTRLDHITIALMSRTMDDDERKIVKTALDHHLESYGEKPDLAKELIEVGDSTPNPDLAVPELAAWTLLTSKVMNLDETLTK